MRIAIFESSTGSGPHVAQLTRGFDALGHQTEAYSAGGAYDLIVVHGQVAHRTDYSYQDFPTDPTPICFVDFAEFGYFKRLPNVQRDYLNCFTPAAMGHDTKNGFEQRRLKEFLEGRSFPYFLREKFRAIDYPAAYHPIDYPLYHLSTCGVRPHRENYLRRNLDLFCWWGMSHPWRVDITQALRFAVQSRGLRAEIGDRWADGNQAQHCYFWRMESSRACPSFDGYGSGSFRMTEVLVRTLLLQGPLQIETRAPLIDGETCRMYDVEHDGQTFVGTNIGAVLAEALADPEGSFGLYERGYDHCMTHLTEKATAQYVLDVVAAHDWSVPTDIGFCHD